ncbi:MAG: hypothetical protein ACREIF_04755 [Chthoniobacterales bacterium]
MKIVSTLVGLLVALAATQSMTARAQSPTRPQVQLISTFDYPGTGTQTLPEKVNNHGDIIGAFIDSQGYRGFILFHTGVFSPPIMDPDDTANFTIGTGINDAQLGCGFYADEGGNHGFFLIGRTIMNYDVAGSTATTIYGVNNDGDFSGSATVDGVEEGFVSLGGVVTEFTVTDAVATTPLALNNLDEICGLYTDSSEKLHGFYRDADGTIHAPIDPPGSKDTELYGYNDNSVIVGHFQNRMGTHGLVFLLPDRFIVYDYPGSTFTSFNGINNHGEIVGRYYDASGLSHGIIAQLVPGSDASGETQ